MSLALTLFRFCSATFQLRDYFYSNPSFDGLMYGDGSRYTLHEIRIEVPVSNFQWVLLGFPRHCTVSIDNSPTYDATLRLQGHSSKYIAVPKKRYQLTFETDDEVSHDINLRNVRIDPSFCREKLFHDVISAMGTTSIEISHTRLYINGEYNGLYAVAEIIDSYFMYDNIKRINETLLYYNHNPRYESTVTRMELEFDDGAKFPDIDGNQLSPIPHIDIIH